MQKRIFSFLLALILSLSLLQITALAGEISWAVEIAEALLARFPDSGFSADNDIMTKADAAAIIEKMGRSTDQELSDGGVFTREIAAEVLADIFGVDTEEQSAIEYLYDQGIINGVESEELDLDEKGTLIKAEFTILADRIISQLGDNWQNDSSESDETDSSAEDHGVSEPSVSDSNDTDITEDTEETETTEAVSDSADTAGSDTADSTDSSETEPDADNKDDTAGSSDNSDSAPETEPITSDWAREEIKQADSADLIPDCLKGEDLRKNISRAEFAAVCVKTYEALKGEKAVPIAENPFTDTADIEILKAYNVGITNGKYANGTQFAPNEGLNRQEAATMLTRVYKKVSMTGWTLATDSEYELSFEMPRTFTDDADIDAWAKQSVYFMAANGIIRGVTDDPERNLLIFAPKNTTEAQAAVNYANATREVALVIAMRMVNTLNK